MIDYDDLGLNFQNEDANIMPDTMDIEYDRIHSKYDITFCKQCLEMCENVLDDGICDACIDENFADEINKTQRTADESIQSWVNRRNDIAIKYFNNPKYFKWCSYCQEPKSWIESIEPIDYDPNDTTMMIWDYEHERVDFCFECHCKSRNTKVEVGD